MAEDLTHLIGQHHLCPAWELSAEKGNNKTLRDEHFLYRWWFSGNSQIVAFIKEQMGDSYLEKLKHKQLKSIDSEEQTYYALYFGKTKQGRTRFREHINGPLKQSTLRRTIRAILTLQEAKNVDEAAISSILQPCYYEWIELTDDHELMDCFETIAIALGNYPLNIDGNHSVDETWKAMILKIRSELKDD